MKVCSNQTNKEIGVLDNLKKRLVKQMKAIVDQGETVSTAQVVDKLGRGRMVCPKVVAQLLPRAGFKLIRKQNNGPTIWIKK